MEEDWDSPTGYSPIDPSAVQNTEWKPPPIDSQRSRGRGFWKENSDSNLDWRRKDEPYTKDTGWGHGRGGGRGQYNRSWTVDEQTRSGENESRSRGRGVLRNNQSEREAIPRRGRGGGFGQSRQSDNWRENQDSGRSVSEALVMKVDSSLVGRIIGKCISPVLVRIRIFY